MKPMLPTSNTARIFCGLTLVLSSWGITGSSYAADADADWLARSTGPGVLMSTRFDTAAEVSNYVLPDAAADHVVWETGNKASGNGSLRFNILKTDYANSGNWSHYLSDDQRDFKQGDEFYVQFRQYFPAFYATHSFSGTQYGGPYAGGWKQAIISHAARSNTLFEVVLQNTDHRGILQGYNRNTVGQYLPWEESRATACSNTDIVMQNAIDRGGSSNTCLGARRRLGGLYSQGFPDPESGAFIYHPNEWITFLLRVKVGTFGVQSMPRDTHVQLWAARNGDSGYTLVIDRMVNLGYDDDGNGNQRFFNSIWLLPYNTARTPDGGRQDTYTLYDELIVSTNPIPAPNVVLSSPPTDLTVQ